MDITLIQYDKAYILAYRDFGFNPCFNGYYTYTGSMCFYRFSIICSFNPCFNGYYTYTTRGRGTFEETDNVSILVLMDITLIHLQTAHCLHNI